MPDKLIIKQPTSWQLCLLNVGDNMWVFEVFRVKGVGVGGGSKCNFVKFRQFFHTLNKNSIQSDFF